MQRVFHDLQTGGHGHEGDRVGDHDGCATYNGWFVNLLLINYRLNNNKFGLNCFGFVNFAPTLVCLYSPRRLKTSI